MSTQEGIFLHRGSAQGDWAVTVPVPDAEQQTEICDGPEHRNKPFTSAELRTFPSWTGGGTVIRYVVAGPNIRQDGTPGAYRLSRWVSREYMTEAYPGGLTLLVQALQALQGFVRTEAEAACTQIEQAVNPS